ncbi:MAG: DUF6913 domain-containing protein [Candidatus Cryptobacteroides sp.]
MGLIFEYLRKRKIRKFAADIPTAMIPLKDVKSVCVLLDVDEFGFSDLNDQVTDWAKKNGLRLTVYYFDFRKLSKDELLLTNIKTTIIKKDLTLIGMPKPEKITELIGEKYDLFISMVNNAKFPVEFVSKCVKAKFKVGRKGFEGDVYDIVVSKQDTPDDINQDSCSVFAAIADLLSKVN